MDSPEVTFTLAYLVLAVCFVFTPTEFHSAGLTVQNLLSGWLGSEDAAFVRYHQRRTAATLLCHSLLPLGEPRGSREGRGTRPPQSRLRAGRPRAPRWRQLVRGGRDAGPEPGRGGARPPGLVADCPAGDGSRERSAG